MNHIQCLSPARAQRPIDAPISPAMYGRLFPDLPSFSAEQELLFALGRAGGLCDCGDEADEPASLASVAAGWPFLASLSPTTSPPTDRRRRRSRIWSPNRATATGSDAE